MSVFLGLASSHDASACVFVDGRLAAAVSLERVTRRKNDGCRLPLEAMRHALEIAGVAPARVDGVATIHSFFPEKFFRRESLAKELEARLVRARRRRQGGERQLNVNDLLKRVAPRGKDIAPYFRRADFLAALGLRPDTRVRFVDHHATHAMAAAWYSGFDDCAVLTIDGVGELNVFHTESLWSGGQLERTAASDRLGASPGEYYEAITEAMGFIPLRHEGKVLGLAAHGDPSHLYADFARALRPNAAKDGFESDFTGRPDAYAAREAYLEALVSAHPREHVAAAAQAVFEDAIVAVARSLLARTGRRALAVNGGVFANVKLNQRLAALPELDRLFVFPAMSDTGNSVGAALFLVAEENPAAARPTLRSVYWGGRCEDEACARALAAAGFAAERLDEDALVARAADAIHAGRVVGWFQGRMEFGPRALGNRSMVARPTDADINRTLNARLARTEFMPFAPSVLEEHAAAIFDNAARSADCLPFMTITCNVRPDWRSRIPAVVHVDGTARPQSVARDTNPLYWKLIEAYRARSGIPLVLNTSFNVHEEPIVCFPENAVQALSEDRIDCLALGPYWAERAGT
jgi:carbamoyltransferase